jgi:hypothetical protein
VRLPVRAGPRRRWPVGSAGSPGERDLDDRRRSSRRHPDSRTPLGLDASRTPFPSAFRLLAGDSARPGIPSTGRAPSAILVAPGRADGIESAHGFGTPVSFAGRYDNAGAGPGTFVSTRADRCASNVRLCVVGDARCALLMVGSLTDSHVMIDGRPRASGQDHAGPHAGRPARARTSHRVLCSRLGTSCRRTSILAPSVLALQKHARSSEFRPGPVCSTSDPAGRRVLPGHAERPRRRCWRPWRNARSPSTGRRIPVPRRSFVLATQNPVELEWGTFPLARRPSADRFLVRSPARLPDGGTGAAHSSRAVRAARGHPVRADCRDVTGHTSSSRSLVRAGPHGGAGSPVRRDAGPRDDPGPRRPPVWGVAPRAVEHNGQSPPRAWAFMAGRD